MKASMIAINFCFLLLIVFGSLLNYESSMNYDKLPRYVRECGMSGCGCDKEDMDMIWSVRWYGLFGAALIISSLIGLMFINIYNYKKTM